MAVFSTGEAGYITYTSTQSIIKLVDRGLLKAWRVPGSRFRRIEEKDLRDFMIRNAIPMDRLPTGTSPIILVSNDSDLCSATQKLSIGDAPIRCLSLFEAGFSWETDCPRAVIIDWNVGEDAARAILAKTCFGPQQIPAAVISPLPDFMVEGAREVVSRDSIATQLPLAVKRLLAG